MHLEAAQGWLELGNHEEANEELERIDAPLRSHPDVLEVRWGIYAKVKNWEACLHIAKAMVKLDPRRFTGWINRSFALHELKRTRTDSNCFLLHITALRLVLFGSFWGFHDHKTHPILF